MAGLSKSRIISGAQCAKLLWWKAHEPDAPELVPDAMQQALFDTGHRVGTAAQEALSGGVLVEYSPDRDQMIAATRDAIDGGATTIYEASFSWDGVFVAVDILERGDDGWSIIEVKSTTTVKPQHHLDAAVQRVVVASQGLRVTRVELMHLNRDYDGLSSQPLFTRTDITREAIDLEAQVRRLAPALREVLDGPCPDVAIGPHCTQPYSCPFMDRCHPVPEPDGLKQLYRVRKPILAELQKDGISRISQIPDTVILPAIAARQRRAIVENRIVVEPEISEALDKIRFPIAYIDFEAIGPAIPPWPEARPYGHIAVQVSIHMVQESGDVEHHEWLAEGMDDPRPALARFLLEVCESAQTFVAYFASFEQRMLRDLAGFLPPLDGARILAFTRRFVDLLPLVRNHVYAPAFQGSFSLKKVLPALVPGGGYDDLDVQSGGIASAQLEGLLVRGEPPEGAERTQMRDSLLAYCERDTWGMVQLVQALRALHGEGST